MTHLTRIQLFTISAISCHVSHSPHMGNRRITNLLVGMFKVKRDFVSLLYFSHLNELSNACEIGKICSGVKDPQQGCEPDAPCKVNGKIPINSCSPDL